MPQKRLCPHCLCPLSPEDTLCPHCRHSQENHNPRGALAYGYVLAGRYTVGDFLSADGEGILYQAVENTGAVRVTLKEYLPVTLAEDRDEAGMVHPKAGREVLYKTTRMDFVDLYREMMKITPATGLEAVLDVLEANNTAYAIMENPGGVPLDQYLASAGGRIAPAEARSMLQPVFEGVAAMHTAGLVHRGISPENIRVLDNGKARLAGYATLGLRTAGSELRPQLYEGYAAPEQYSTAEFEGRYTDAYALAGVFYRMVTGQAPVPAAQRLVADSQPSARSLDATLPGWLSDVLDHAMQLRPADRIQTVPVLMSSLTSPAAAQAIVKANDRGKQQRNMRGLYLLGGGLILLAVIAILLAWAALSRPTGQQDASSAPEATTAPVTEKEYVPDFVGMTYAQIQASGQYTGHYRFYLQEEYSDTVAAGVIMDQTPKANTEVDDESDRTITLVVSKGPENVEVPNVIGYTQESAVQELQARSLAASCVMMANDGSYVPGCVVKTEPLNGDLVAPGTVITVYIAAERDVEIPDPTPTPTPSPTPDPNAVVDTTDPNTMQGFD